eukprot:2164686-Pyramimonas_sp.AAC.1
MDTGICDNTALAESSSRMDSVLHSFGATCLTAGSGRTSLARFGGRPLGLAAGLGWATCGSMAAGAAAATGGATGGSSSASGRSSDSNASSHSLGLSGSTCAAASASA